MAASSAKRSDSEQEAEIRSLIEARIQAIRAKDVDGAMSRHTPDAVLFDVINPLRYIGSDVGKKRAQQWFSSFEGPLGYEIQDLHITAKDGAAYSYGLNHVKGTQVGGRELDMWWRATVCYEQIDGEWAITHEHSSVPFDMESGTASLGLKP